MSEIRNYFVVFKIDGDRLGNAEVRCDKPISSIADIRDLEGMVQTKEGVKQVIIIQWRLFEEQD